MLPTKNRETYYPKERLVIDSCGCRFTLLTPAEYVALGKSLYGYQTTITYLESNDTSLTRRGYHTYGATPTPWQVEQWGKNKSQEIVIAVLESEVLDPKWGEVCP